ncbi:MAG: hypothetical protein PHC64_07085 [Candidatus Gastranaerophilales bacterium]|nr:hypothetical protein [Candidatus Gastranaerophilales bacterium]
MMIKSINNTPTFKGKISYQVGRDLSKVFTTSPQQDANLVNAFEKAMDGDSVLELLQDTLAILLMEPLSRIRIIRNRPIMPEPLQSLEDVLQSILPKSVPFREPNGSRLLFASGDYADVAYYNLGNPRIAVNLSGLNTAQQRGLCEPCISSFIVSA